MKEWGGLRTRQASTRAGLMKLKTLFIAQGALWAILGLMGIVAGESVIAGWGIEVTLIFPHSIANSP
ncbi:MAG: hypothetical protein AAEI92_10850 [Arenicellales bacterium]